MNKETVDYVIIGAAATAVLYYLYTRSTPKAAAAVNPLAAFNQPPAPFDPTSTTNSGFWNFMNTPVSTIRSDIYNTWYGGYDGSGAGGTW